MRLFRGVVALACACVGVLVPVVSASAADVWPEIVLDAPSTVAPAAIITVTGNLSRSDGASYGHEDVEMTAWCIDPNGDTLGLGNARTDNQGDFDVSLQAGACSYYRFRARYYDADLAVSAETDATVQVTRASAALVATAPPTVWTADDIPVQVSLTGPGSAPVVGAPIRVVRFREDVGTDVEQAWWNTTTDANGAVTVVDNIATDGEYHYYVSYPGSVDLHYDSWTTGSVVVSHRPVSLTVTGPSTAQIDQPFTLTGTVAGPPLPAMLKVAGPGGLETTATTDEDGSFEVPVTPAVRGAGSWKVIFEQTPLYAGRTASTAVTVIGLPTSIEAAAPVAVPTNQRATISGVLHGVDGPSLVQVSGAGGKPITAPTAADGSFSVGYGPLPAGGGDHAVQVSFAGDARHEPSGVPVVLHFVKVATKLVIGGAPPAVEIGKTFRIAGTLQANAAVPSVKVTGPTGATWTAPVDGNGFFAVSVKAYGGPGLMRYTVSYAGNAFEAGSTATAYVRHKWRPVLRLRSVRPRAVVGKISYYRLSDDPVFVTTQTPVFAGKCHRYYVQRLRSSGWYTVKTSSRCLPVPASGVTRWRWFGTPQRGVTYRVQAGTYPDARLFGAGSAPRYVRFR